MIIPGKNRADSLQVAIPEGQEDTSFKARMSRRFLRCVKGGLSCLAGVAELAGRLVECLFMGRSEYHLVASEFQSSPAVDNSVQAKMVLDETRAYLKAEYGFVIQHPVILQLAQPRTHSWKELLTAHLKHMGSCSAYSLGQNEAHSVTIVPGLPRSKFRAVLAHELTHAYQHEKHFLAGQKGWREGMARWVEYHTLRKYGLDEEADRLLTYRTYMLGKALNQILEYEEKHGRAACLTWLSRVGAESPSEE